MLTPYLLGILTISLLILLKIKMLQNQGIFIPYVKRSNNSCTLMMVKIEKLPDFDKYTYQHSAENAKYATMIITNSNRYQILYHKYAGTY